MSSLHATNWSYEESRQETRVTLARACVIMAAIMDSFFAAFIVLARRFSPLLLLAAVANGVLAAPFLYRFLDVTGKAISEDQVTTEHNFGIIAAYCGSFAGDLPTKKEAAVLWAGSTFRLNDAIDSVAQQAWAEDESAILRSFASWACDRAQRNAKARKGEEHEKMQALKQIIQSKKEDMRPDTQPAESKDEAHGDDDDHACQREGEDKEADDEEMEEEEEEGENAPEPPQDKKEGAQKSPKDKKDEPQKSPKDKKKDPQKSPEDKKKCPQKPEDKDKDSQKPIDKVKAHWAPKFRELAKKDDRLELDELVLTGSKGSWTIRLEGHETTISPRFTPSSGHWYVTDPDPGRIPGLNLKYKMDFAINQKGGLTMGWNHFDSLELSPGTQKFVRDWGQLEFLRVLASHRIKVEGCFTCSWVAAVNGFWQLRQHEHTQKPRSKRLAGMADWMLSDLALSRECLLALAYAGFPSLMLHLVDYIAQNATGSNRVRAEASVLIAFMSYDSSKEDAQNPFPEYEETPPGKRTFQGKKAGRGPLRVDSAATLVVETPPPKLKRPGSTELSGSLSKKVRHALKADATKAQKNLEDEFEEADCSQGQEDPDTTANKEAPKGKRTSPKAKAKAKNKARVASSKPKATKPNEDPSKTKPKKDSGKTPATKPSKKPDSKAKAKATPKKDSGKTAATKPSIDDGSETEEPSDKKARSSKDPMPRSPKRSPKKAGAKPTSPQKSKASKNEQEEQSMDEKKKIAHRMYMRFYRSVHSKNKMSSLYEDFLQTEGNWRNSLVYKSIKSITRNGRRGIRRWITKRQMLTVFDSAEVVDSIIARKETDDYLRSTEVREHPDCPGLMQYLVLVEEEVTDEDMDEIEDMFRMEDDKEEMSPEDKEKEEEKVRLKKTKQDANKVIGQLSKMIRDHNTKIGELEGLFGAKSKTVQNAVRKEVNDAIAQLTACRANLQAAIDGHQEEQMLSMTDAAKDLMKKMEGSVLAFSKKKSALPPSSEMVFDMIDNASSIGREDAAGALLPAPLTKMGSFCGKNNARDFARSVRLPVVLAYAPTYVETIVKKKADSEEEVRVKIPVLLPHCILAYVFDELGLNISTDALSKYWKHCKRYCPWASDPAFDGTHIPVTLYGDTARYGQGYDQSKVTGCFLMFLVENGYFGDPVANSLHKLLVVAFRDFKTFQRSFHHQLKDVKHRRLNTRLHHTFREEDAMRWLKGA
ncbi:unnamed protein product [Symbiodinium sp. CCMP2592]|nr:unnamed protein product [Symbiodinium sp. CCMP2592]